MLLGTFGYFYTVLPAFQLAQLQEQTAKLELDKSASEKRLAALIEQQVSVELETKVLQLNLDSERRRGEQLAASINLSRRVAAVASQRAAEAEAKTAEQQRILGFARWELVLNDWSSSYYFEKLRTGFQSSSSDYRGDNDEFIFRAEKGWPEPLKELLDAVDAALEKREQKDGIPENFYNDLRERIRAASKDLECAPPDFHAMAQAFNDRTSKIDAAVALEAERQMEKTRQEYAGRGQRAVFADGYLEQVSRSIRFSKRLEAQQISREELSSLRKSCDEKAYSLLKQVAREKGVKLL